MRCTKACYDGEHYGCVERCNVAPLPTGFGDFRQGDGLSNAERRDLTRRLDEIDATHARAEAASHHVYIRGCR